MKKAIHLSTILCWCIPVLSHADESFHLRDGDRVVLLGSTLIEREQRSAYWETALTIAWPDSNIKFRNLAWSGDNVFGESRLAFDINNMALGLKRMVDLVIAEKPTVIIICYGMNESFAGDAGLAQFSAGYEKLLDSLSICKARIVLMSPNPFEAVSSIKDRVEELNKNLAHYRDAIKTLADKRHLIFADLFDAMGNGSKTEPKYTENGMHLSQFGYWKSVPNLKIALGIRVKPIESVSIAENKLTTDLASPIVHRIEKSQFEATLHCLPMPSSPAFWQNATRKELSGRSMIIKNISLVGDQMLKIDGQKCTSASASRWSEGVVIQSGPDLDQAEKLRQAIIQKNQLYFYRWRPQNETYLFGFRKHEQGRNAKEIAEFDPLIAKAEAEIARLRKPNKHLYEFTINAKEH